MTRAVYRALGVRAADVLANRGAVIADATFLTPDARRGIEGVAERAGVPFTGVWLEAPVDLMAARLRARVGDASDATVDVLEAQRAGDAGPITWHRMEAVEDPGTLAAMVMALR